GGYYTQVVRDVIAGRWKPAAVWGGVRSGMVDLGAIDAALPAAHGAAIDAARGGLVDGRTHVFAAPLADNQGRVRLATGVLGDAQIAAMDWLVQGVIGNVPPQ
ncbi:MAG TPA: BMP family ABC transporter substrate-binding protein, partial [Burkholderiaceae bacterium]|nr:BMP family ABC transporter substrate-binding protein [Burkholderiaceae bacterium]